MIDGRKVARFVVRNGWMSREVHVLCERGVDVRCLVLNARWQRPGSFATLRRRRSQMQMYDRKVESRDLTWHALNTIV